MRSQRVPTATVRAALLAMLAMLGLVAAGCSGDGSPEAEDHPTPSATASTRDQPGGQPGGQAEGLQREYEAVVRHTLTSVVQLTVSGGLGSGVVYDKAGHIVTNAHVVGQSKSVRVRPATGGTPLAAHVVATYPPGDLAVVKLDRRRTLNPAEFADSGKLQVGQIVLAMGNPLGLSGSVTNGIVSAVGRSIPEPAHEGLPGTTIGNMIQTSAPINPGNSGGALVDLSGAVIGIPTLAATDPQASNSAAPGIGFAIPSNTVTRIADQIIEHGRVVDSGRAALGVTGSTVTDAGGTPEGVGVESVKAGSAAARAGIRPGDVITAVGGAKTPTSAALGEVLVKRRPGQVVTMTIVRDGSAHRVEVKLGQG
ncbi:S1C family serine protease [Actinopolymorpha singaporensis]